MAEKIEFIQQLIKHYKILVSSFFIVFLLIVLAFIITVSGTKKNESGTAVVDNQQNISFKESSSGSNHKSEKMVILVDVKGAVNKPGVYDITDNPRTQVALAKAGGVVENADISQVNLAQKQNDGGIIYIPVKGEISPNYTQKNGEDGKGENKVNLNTANSSELQNLEGIGSKKAEQIIAYREEHGQFKQIDDLKMISGIGEKRFETLKDRLTV